MLEDRWVGLPWVCDLPYPDYHGTSFFMPVGPRVLLCDNSSISEMSGRRSLLSLAWWIQHPLWGTLSMLSFSRKSLKTYGYVRVTKEKEGWTVWQAQGSQTQLPLKFMEVSTWTSGGVGSGPKCQWELDQVLNMPRRKEPSWYTNV